MHRLKIIEATKNIIYETFKNLYMQLRMGIVKVIKNLNLELVKM